MLCSLLRRYGNFRRRLIPENSNHIVEKKKLYEWKYFSRRSIVKKIQTEELKCNLIL